VFSYSGTGGAGNHVLLGGRDGYIRKFHRSNQTDDGTIIDSYCWLGPIRLGGSDYLDGILTEVVAILDDESGDVDWELYVGDSPEEALVSTAITSDTWDGGVNYKDRPRVRGTVCFIKLKQSNIDTTVDGEGTYTAGTQTTEIDVDDAVFNQHHVGRDLKFDTTGNTYVINAVTDADTIVVDGDASNATGGETLNDGVTLGTDGPWALERITAAMHAAGLQRKL
jgi:hypothetical protein